MFVLYVSRPLRIFTLLILTFVLAGSANAQKHFCAYFSSSIDGKPILYARATNDLGMSRLTNADGFVSVPVSDGGKVVITHISYDTLIVNISDLNLKDTFHFYLNSRIYQLQTVNLSVLGPRRTFDNRFVQLDLGESDEDKVKKKLKIEDMKGELIALDQASSDGMVLGSPITALYDQFSKAGKEKKKYNALVRQDLIDSLNQKKFNPEVVAMLVEMSPEETEAFLIFCSFHSDYIANATALELYIEVLRCKEEYLELKNASTP